MVLPTLPVATAAQDPRRLAATRVVAALFGMLFSSAWYPDGDPCS